MKRYLFAAAMVTAIAAPAFADEVGVHVGPVGAGVTVGQSHEYRERDRDRDRTTVIREREPANRTTVIKKEDEFRQSQQDRDSSRQRLTELGPGRAPGPAVCTQSAHREFGAE
ncbi:hypothetical protein ACVWZ3_003490 [Bradyrhizobium sp. i1.3.6]